MFTKSAKFYDALYSFKNYDETSDKLHTIIQKSLPDANTLLDVACGTGKHLEYLKDYYSVEGLDINNELLDIARQRNPEVAFNCKDMTDFDLNKTFDVVTCLFSSIGYVKSKKNLESAVLCMANHLNKKGLLVVEPWFSPDNYWVDRLTANYVDEPDLKISWMYVSRKKGKLSIMDINYLVGTLEGISYFKERHEFGLFTHEEYLEAFRMSDLEVAHDPRGLFGRGMYIGLKSS